jgi:hypothetical protein
MKSVEAEEEKDPGNEVSNDNAELEDQNSMSQD